MKTTRKLLFMIAVFLMLACVSACGPKYESIRAEYSGDTSAGIVIDNNNEDIKVFGVTKDGEEELEEWTLEQEVELQPDETATLRISSNQLSCELPVKCSSSAVVSIEAKYKGDTKAGTVVNEKSDIEVVKHYKNGESEIAKEGWKVTEPVTLEADTSSIVTITCDGKSTDITIACSTSKLEKITAEYTGDTSEGIVLDKKNKDIVVTAFYKNGKSEEVKDFTIEEAATLTIDNPVTVRIKYEEQECNLEVQGTKNAVLGFINGFNATVRAIYENENTGFWHINMEAYDKDKGFVLSSKIRIELNVSEKEIKPEDEVRSFMLVIDDYNTIDPYFITAYSYCCVGGLSPELSYEEIGSLLNALLRERGGGVYGSIRQNGVFYSMGVAGYQMSLSGIIED